MALVMMDTGMMSKFPLSEGVICDGYKRSKTLLVMLDLKPESLPQSYKGSLSTDESSLMHLKTEARALAELVVHIEKHCVPVGRPA